VRVLGIDPGLADVGYGLVDYDESTGALRHVAHGALRTDRSQSLADRLAAIHAGLRRLIGRHRPDEIAVEELFFAANARTAVAVAQARGVAILAAAAEGRALAEYSPPRVKLALVGHGRAGKDQIRAMVRVLLGLKELPASDHAADALAAAICHIHYSRTVERLRASLGYDRGSHGASESDSVNERLLKADAARRVGSRRRLGAGRATAARRRRRSGRST